MLARSIVRLRGTFSHVLTGLLAGLILVGSGGLVGCATVVSDGGGERPLMVTSEPAGAAVYTKRGMEDWRKHPGVTPTTIHLDPAKGNGDYQLKLELGGYEPLLAHISSDVDPWLFGSMALTLVFVVPGLVATGVDFATGAWKKLDHESMHLHFPADRSASTAD